MTIIILLFLFGLAVGSFLNVLIDRLPADESITYPPSHCDHCKKPLAWYDLIPVVSFLHLRGRCRYCHKPISWRYPLVEFLTGVIFLFVAFSNTSPLGSRFATPQGWPDGFIPRIHPEGLPWGEIWELLFALFIVANFIVVFFTDLKYGIIPDKIIFPAIGVAFIYLVYFNLAGRTPETCEVGCHVVSALSAFTFFLAIYMVTRGRGMGFGDVKFSFLLGLLFGFPTIMLVLYTAFLTGATFSIILILIGKKKLRETIAFGPFLVFAALFVFFFEDEIASIVWFLPG